MVVLDRLQRISRLPEDKEIKIKEEQIQPKEISAEDLLKSDKVLNELFKETQ